MIELSDRRSECLWTFLAQTVVGQQLSSAAAGTIWKRIESLGADLGVALQELFLPQNLETVRECGVSASKFKAISGLVTAFEHGRLDVDMLDHRDHMQIRNKIGQFWGLGPWSGDMVALFYAGCSDVWSDADTTLCRGVTILTGDDEADTAEFAARYAPYRSYLARHIWAGVDTGKISRSGS